MASNQAQKLADKFSKKYGGESAFLGSGSIQFKGVIPTPSLSLDYALGTGGWPRGAAIEVFGVNHIGKTALFGYGSVAKANAEGHLAAIIAVEPDFDLDWAVKNGVDPDMTLVLRPDNGEEAFDMLLDLVEDATCQLILFDSIGALVANKEIESDKPQAFGNAALISWGVRRVAMRAFKNGVTIIYLNQVRDDTKSRIPGLVDSPGGHVLKHVCAIRIHVKPGGVRHMIKVNNGTKSEDMLVGREIVASFKKNKAGSSATSSARFDWYFKDSDLHKVGVDEDKDIISVAKVTGVFQGAGWLKYEHFPNGKLNGAEKVREFLAENPNVIKQIRKDVLSKMDTESTAISDDLNISEDESDD